MTDVLSFRADAPAPGTVRVNMATRAELMADLEAQLSGRRGFTLATLNLDHLVKLRRNPDFLAAYAAHSHVVADGNPIVWLHRLAGRPIGLVPGSELITPLAALCARLDVPVALLGATPATLGVAAERLAADHPGLRVVAEISPPYGFDPAGTGADACLEQLRRSGARLCFLALGAPKQEIFAARASTRLTGCGFVSIGAGLDFISGDQKRAPLWVRRLAMEWVWRMALSPRRLARRYLDCLLLMPGATLSALRARQQG